MAKGNLRCTGILLKIEMKQVKNISSCHQFEDDAIAQFESAKQQNDVAFFILRIT